MSEWLQTAIVVYVLVAGGVSVGALVTHELTDPQGEPITSWGGFICYVAYAFTIGFVVLPVAILAAVYDIHERRRVKVKV